MRPGRMPRKYDHERPPTWTSQGGFNEAGADAPEIPDDLDAVIIDVRASMRPGRMPRKYFVDS